MLDAALAGPLPVEEDRSLSFDGVVVTGRDAPGAARLAFDSFCIGLPEDVARTGLLLLSEVVTNAVIHGSAGNASTIELHFATVGDMLQVEVSDDGPGFDPAAREHASDAESGWGLQLVEAMAESWGVDNRPTRVWFELDMEPAETLVAS
jgi:anti-sigma regulatory factor (Ser/Thr protein kinase)